MNILSALGRRRLVELDLLRFAAIALVLGRHGPVCPSETSPALHAVTATWQRGGWVGVDLFFVLSGFLVSGLLFAEHQRTGKVRAGRFLIRRGFKIYPAFWALLIATVLISAAFVGQKPIGERDALGEVFFLQNYVGEYWSQTWSLAVEEHFYLGLAAFAVVMVWRRGPRAFDIVPALFLVIATACLVARLVTAWAEPFNYRVNIFPTHLRIDALFFGVLLSYLWNYRGLRENALLRRYRIAIGVAGVLLLAPAFVWQTETHPWIYTVGLTMFYLGSGLLLLSALSFEMRKRRVVTAVAALGAYSYSIYLWHLAIWAWLVPWLAFHVGTTSWFFVAGVYYVGAIVLGVLLAKLVEYPVLRFRDRVFPSSAKAVERTPPSPRLPDGRVLSPADT